MKFLFSATAVFLMFSEMTFGQTKNIPEQQIFTSALVPTGVFFAATMDQGTSEITMTMKGPSDRWFGVGFGSTMSNADVLMYTDGRAGAMHTLGVWDYRLTSTTATGVNKDVTENWTVVSNTVNLGVRTVVATRALDTGDSQDQVINFNNATLNVIAARGATATNTLAYHGANNRGTATFTWEVPDLTAPDLAVNPFSPADNQTNVLINTNLTVTFNEAIAAGSGNVELYLSTTSALVESFDVATQVTISGNQMTMNPTASLLGETDYYVTIADGAVEDLAGNTYIGFGDNDIWNFTTGLATNELTEGSKSFVISVDMNGVFSFKNFSGGSYDVKMSNLLGQELIPSTRLIENKSFDVSKYKGQVILIHVQNDQGQMTKKISL